MNKRDFFIYSINNELILNRGWGESVFGVLLKDSFADKDKFVHSPIKVHGVELIDNMLFGWVDGKEEQIIDFVMGEPLYSITEELNIKAHELKCIKKDIETSYGIAYMNALFIERPYQGKVDFINSVEGKPIKPSVFNDVAKEHLIKTRDMEAHLKFENAVGFITALADCCIVSFTEKTLVANPLVKAKKEELLLKYKDKLDDAATVAQIQKELDDLDKEYLKGDPGEYFFSIGKNAPSRSRIYNIYGGEEDYYDPSKTVLVDKSLSEGFELKDVPVLANSIRSGSYHRAVDTANGGAKVKETTRLFQNYKITIDDCNTKKGLTVRINMANSTKYIGRYQLGSKEALTKESLKKLYGKVIKLRSPQYCESVSSSICKVCAGKAVADSKIGITALTNAFTNTLMLIDMAAMHKAGLKTYDYDYINRIT